MALRNPCFKDQIGLICEGRTRREEEKKEEEEERKRKKMEVKAKKAWMLAFCMEIELKYGFMETTLSMDFVWITWNLRLDMVNLLSLNLGF